MKKEIQRKKNGRKRQRCNREKRIKRIYIKTMMSGNDVLWPFGNVFSREYLERRRTSTRDLNETKRRRRRGRSGR